MFISENFFLDNFLIAVYIHTYLLWIMIIIVLVYKNIRQEAIENHKIIQRNM